MKKIVVFHNFPLISSNQLYASKINVFELKTTEKFFLRIENLKLNFKSRTNTLLKTHKKYYTARFLS